MESFSALLALCAENSPAPVNSPHKGQWRGALMLSLICVWINDWVNNPEAGDLRRHRGHYDVNVMWRKHTTACDWSLTHITPRGSGACKSIWVLILMTLYHWSRNTMAAVFQTTFSKAFSCEWKYLNFDQNFTVSKCLIYQVSALVQLMAWHRPGDKPLSEPIMIRLPTNLCVSLSISELLNPSLVALTKITSVKYECNSLKLAGTFIRSETSLTVINSWSILFSSTMSTLGWPDYVVFASMLIVSILIGLYFAYQSRHQSNPEQFLMADRKMQVLPVAFSILVRWVLWQREMKYHNIVWLRDVKR